MVTKAKATATAAKKARKATTKSAEATVDGHPNIKQVLGIGTGRHTIAAIVRANNDDDAAVLNDGTMHIVTDYLRHNVVCKPGMNFDQVKNTYLALVRKEAETKATRGAGHLATGVDARNSPHSAKAVADNRAAAKTGKAPTAKAAKADKKAAAKVARAAKAAPKADDQRKITIVDKKFTFGGDGTARRESWDACKAAKSVADYLKAGGKAKYLPRWVSAGAIKLA